METKDKIIGTALILTGIVFIGLGLMVMLKTGAININLGGTGNDVELNQDQVENNDVNVYNQNDVNVYAEDDVTEDEGGTRYIY